MSEYAAAEELATSIRGYLAPAECLVTLDPTEAGNNLAAGSPVVIIGVPSVEFPTFGTAEAAWEVLIVSDELGDRRAAWQALVALRAPLLAPLGVTSSEPVTYPTSGGREFSGYLIRFTTTFNIEE